MRDYILFSTIIVLLPICVFRPWIGVLAWAWLGYMNPHRLVWDFAYGYPFAQMIAIATIGGTAWYAFRGRGMHGFFAGFELKALFLLWAIFSLTSLVALRQGYYMVWEDWDQITKVIVMVVLTTYLVDSEKKLRLLVLTITFSLGFYGVKGGIFSIFTGGEYRVWGPAASFLEDNNALALALNMTLPFMYFLGKIEERLWLRYVFYGMFGLTVLAIIFTYSRGGFLGLLVVLGSIFLTTRLRQKLVIAAVAVICLPFVAEQIPDRWTDRMATIQSYEEDGSALSRIEGWKAAWNLAIDRPLTGGGFQALNDPDIFIEYNPDIIDIVEGANESNIVIAGVHSIYFELLAENGFPGLIVFLVICASLFRTQRSLIVTAKDESQKTQGAYGQMLSISMIAYLACGTFLELASFDFFYQILSLTVVSKRLFLENVNSQTAHLPIRQASPAN